MSYASLLINVCVIERFAAGVADAFGNPAKNWAAHLTVDGRLSSATGRERQDATEVTQVDEMLFLEDVDVTEHDRVTVDGVTFNIVFVTDKQNGTGDHHKELGLVRVKA